MEHIDAGLLLLRVVFGVVLMGHGCRKLFGWFHGPGLTRSAEMFDSIGYRPGRLLVMVASGTEIIGGLLLVSGVGWPLGPMMAVGTMLVAASTHWSHGFWASQGGIEQPFAYAVVAAGLLLTGPGAARLALIPEIEMTLPIRGAALVLAIAGAGVLMLYRVLRVRRDRDGPGGS